jgi:RNA polymerase sigma-70 factor (ECF subfamily)
MQQLAAGQQEALGPLYSRYAARIFRLASQSLDRATAEEIVQDVFLTVWRKATAFDPQRGAFQPWIYQIAHFRILNELRRQSRRPQIDPDSERLRLAEIVDPDPEPDEVLRQAEQRATLRSAIEALPPAQRQALNLAFFEDLTHQQVAAELDLPVGTTKTRIRAGLQKLRASLSPAVAALVVAAVGAYFGVRYHNEQAVRALDERALALVTSSETVAIRLVAAPGVAAATHAVYRGQAGAAMAVLTLDDFPPAPAGQTYQAWVRHGQTWTSLGTVKPDQRGDARLIAQGPVLAVLPDAIEITREPSGGSPAPTGPVVVSARR